MLRGYCDESYDDKQQVYSVAGYVAKDREWSALSRNWKNRNLKDGIDCFHATDCEHGTRDFTHLRKVLYAAGITLEEGYPGARFKFYWSTV